MLLSSTRVLVFAYTFNTNLSFGFGCCNVLMVSNISQNMQPVYTPRCKMLETEMAVTKGLL
jgi:hypothetical protein